MSKQLVQLLLRHEFPLQVRLENPRTSMENQLSQIQPYLQPLMRSPIRRPIVALVFEISEDSKGTIRTARNMWEGLREWWGKNATLYTEDEASRATGATKRVLNGFWEQIGVTLEILRRKTGMVTMCLNRANGHRIGGRSKRSKNRQFKVPPNHNREAYYRNIM